uniref:Uncharacterized protein n=1 Tax=Panagrolaimus sp. PS1159 TaxID=55785 RepID=A0AC35FCF4_9BILA
MLQEESDLPLSKEVILSYKKMKTIYEKIKENENDDKKWMNALIEAEDDEIVEHNVEYRLSENLTNKNLWKMYIQFWKQRDTKVRI